MRVVTQTLRIRPMHRRVSQDFGSQPKRFFVDIKIWIVQRATIHFRTSTPDADHGSRNVLQIERKIFASHTRPGYHFQSLIT